VGWVHFILDSGVSIRTIMAEVLATSNPAWKLGVQRLPPRDTQSKASCIVF
jgi:hypothetical protein